MWLKIAYISFFLLVEIYICLIFLKVIIIKFILGNLIVKKPEPKEIIKVKIKEVEPVFILPEPVIQKPIVEPKPEKTVENWITAKYLKAKVVIVKDELYGDERQKTIYEDPANLKFIEVLRFTLGRCTKIIRIICF